MSCINLLLIGPMGTGKSTIGMLLANKFYDSDNEIEHYCCNISLIFFIEGEAIFRLHELGIVGIVGIVLATGGGILLSRLSNTIFGFLNTSVKQQFSRTAQSKRPNLIHGKKTARLRELFLVRERLYRTAQSCQSCKQ